MIVFYAVRRRIIIEDIVGVAAVDWFFNGLINRNRVKIASKSG